MNDSTFVYLYYLQVRKLAKEKRAKRDKRDKIDKKNTRRIQFSDEHEYIVHYKDIFRNSQQNNEVEETSIQNVNSLLESLKDDDIVETRKNTIQGCVKLSDEALHELSKET